MRIAFIIYTGMTALDFIGVYDPVTRLKTMGFTPNLQWKICAYTEDVSDRNGLSFISTQVGESLESYDMVIVLGGIATRKLIGNVKFIHWVKTANPCRFKVSVCTGSLLLGAAGFLRGKTAATHPSAYPESVVDQRIVDEGEVLTARGVTSSIDLGLYLCEKLAGPEAKEQTRQVMDYQQV